MTELIMAESDRLVWREAFDLYDWNHGLNNTEAAWIHFIRPCRISRTAMTGGTAPW